MPSKLKLTDRDIESLTKTTACGGVPGFSVLVRKLSDGTVSKFFILRMRKEKRVITLGKYPAMSVNLAYQKALEVIALPRTNFFPGNKTPLDASVLHRKVPQIVTFEVLMEKWLAFQEKEARRRGTIKSKRELWKGYFNQHIPEKIRKCPVERLTPRKLQRMLEEKWTTMVDTPTRILGDICKAIDWGIEREIIPAMRNPARYGGTQLDKLLPRKEIPAGVHDPALDPERMPAFFAALMKLVPGSQTAASLAFGILTAARNTTAREACWEEIRKNSEGRWEHVIPRIRIQEFGRLDFDRHTPLSSAAVDLLERVPRIGGESRGLIFPNIFRTGYASVSREAFPALIKRMHDAQKKIDGIGWTDPELTHPRTGDPRIVTMQGLSRGTFEKWAYAWKKFDHPCYSEALIRSCLDKLSDCYTCEEDHRLMRGQMRLVFEEWGRFCTRQTREKQPKPESLKSTMDRMFSRSAPDPAANRRRFRGR